MLMPSKGVTDVDLEDLNSMGLLDWCGKEVGYCVDANGISPLESKVQVIRDLPKPTSQRKLREFLGLVNFYRRFFPGSATILALPICMLSSDQNSAASLN